MNHVRWGIRQRIGENDHVHGGKEVDRDTQSELLESMIQRRINKLKICVIVKKSVFKDKETVKCLNFLHDLYVYSVEQSFT